MARSSIARALHDVGIAGWFGGSMMGAIGVNGAASDVDDPRQRARVANSGWARWAPVNAAFIGAHLLGGALIVRDNSGRIKAQKGVAGWTTAKTALTGAALLATAASGRAGAKLIKAGDFPAAGGTEPLPQTPPELASAQKQLKALQWAIPALTGGVIVSASVMGEQQRPAEVTKGALKRAGSATKTAAQHPHTTAAATARLARHRA